MKSRMFFKVLLLSLLTTALLSAMSLLFLNRLVDMASGHHRNRFLLFVTELIEYKLRAIPAAQLRDGKPIEIDLELPSPDGPEGRGPHHRSLHHLFKRHAGPREEPLPGGPPREPKGRPRPPPIKERVNFWLMNRDKKVLFSNAKLPLPEGITERSLPVAVKKVNRIGDFFRIGNTVNIIKLDTANELYFVSQEKRKFFPSELLGIQAVLTFVTVGVAFLLSFVFTIFYFRKKSKQARSVLLKMEEGDLKARFEIKAFDEFAGLAMGFNRMADEIEKLVTRIHTNEASRKKLLQELGHDLRTPMTSLITSFETLGSHYDKMADADRKDLIEMGGADIKYFKDLLEKLLMIAGLDEPTYKTTAAKISVSEILKNEVNNFRGGPLRWTLTLPNTEPESQGYILGDSHLVLRLVKNALDNASRYAKQEVTVRLDANETQFEIHVCDDGDGLSEAALKQFGVRREQRVRRLENSLNFSLGLGSVIMKTISELHGGHVQIRNRSGEDGKIVGAELIIYLPRLAT